jgi:hypothetical protein
MGRQRERKYGYIGRRYASRCGYASRGWFDTDRHKHSDRYRQTGTYVAIQWNAKDVSKAHLLCN